MATTKTNSPSDTSPKPPMVVPAMVPSRIATNVPICTMALPPTSSVASRCWGSTAYFSGPKKVDCVPSRNSAANSAGTLCEKSAMPASAATPISPSFTKRISRAFSNLSAKTPAVAENRKNGRMNNPAARLTRIALLSASSTAAMAP